VKVNPVKVNPVKVNPVKVNPVKVNPAKVNPVKANPPKANPAKREFPRKLASLPLARRSKRLRNGCSEPVVAVAWSRTLP
jgi:hypothetical protein